MGLLEKALKYKSEINKQGKRTVMDSIAGPADTDIVQNTPNEEKPPKSKIPEIDVYTDEKQPIQSLETIEEINAEEIMHLKNNDLIAVETDLTEVTPIDISEPLAQSAEIIDELEPIETPLLQENDSAPIEEGKGETVIEDDFDEDLFSLPGESVEISEPIMSTSKGKKSEEPLNSIEQDEISQKVTKAKKIVDPLGPDDIPILKAGGKKTVIKTETESDEIEVIEESVTVIDTNTDKKHSAKSDEYDASQSEDILDSITLSEDIADENYQDFMLLYESGKEILNANSKEELFDVILFSVMGQMGVSSSSILLPDHENVLRWKVHESRGVTITDRNLFFHSDRGIINDILTQQKVVDLETYKDVSDFREDYYKCISVDARYAVPLVYDKEVVGIVFLGEKITGDEYTDEDLNFVYSLGEFAAIALRNIVFKGIQYNELDALEKNIDYITEIDNVRDKIVNESKLSDVKEIIQDEMKSLDIEIFSIFMKDNKDSFIPIIYESDDFLSFQNNNFSIHQSEYFITYLYESESPIQTNLKNPIITEIFDKKQISNMNMIRIYTFHIGAHLTGFIIVSRIGDESRQTEIDIKLKRFSDVIFPYIISMKNIDSKKSKYIDNIDHIFRRIDEEIKRSSQLSIPLSLVLFSIKNYKRYFSMFGYSEVQNLLLHIEQVISSRLSEGDFSIRYDRHKILLVLPGKDKKFAVPLATSIINEIINSFNKDEMQLLITYLTAEYPVDGNDLYSLIDAVD